MSAIRLTALTAALTIAAATAAAQTTEDHTILKPDPEAFAQFGECVDICGDVLVASTDQDQNPAGLGLVYVYRHDPVAGQWNFEQELQHDPGVGCGGTCHFGHTISLSEDRIVVGAPHDEPQGLYMCGSTYVFHYDEASGQWLEEGHFYSPYNLADFDHNGHSNDIDGDVLVTGADRWDDPALGMSEWEGAAFVYRHDGRDWQFEQILSGSQHEQNMRFSMHLSVSGDWIAAGAPAADSSWVYVSDGTASGVVYLYKYDEATGQWNEMQSIPFHGVNDITQFGAPVELQGDLLVIGAPIGDLNGTPHAGGAHVYRLDPATETWQYEQFLAPSLATMGDDYGAWVALDGSQIAVGGWLDSDGTTLLSGSVTLFEYDFPTGIWEEIETFGATGQAPFDMFGWDVSLEGGRLLVGSRGYDLPGFTDAGAAYVYDVPRFSIEPDPMPAGGMVDVELSDAQSLEGTFLAASLDGRGSAPVPPFGITLDLESPVQVSTVASSDAAGQVAWSFFVPASLSGSPVWFQPLQDGWKGLVVESTVQ